MRFKVLRTCPCNAWCLIKSLYLSVVAKYSLRDTVLTTKKSARITLSEGILKLILEGKVRLIRNKKLRYGKWRILRRYVVSK